MLTKARDFEGYPLDKDAIIEILLGDLYREKMNLTPDNEDVSNTELPSPIVQTRITKEVYRNVVDTKDRNRIIVGVDPKTHEYIISIMEPDRQILTGDPTEF